MASFQNIQRTIMFVRINKHCSREKSYQLHLSDLTMYRLAQRSPF